MVKNEQGFTLIELLIVIIILGILAVVGIPKFMNSKAGAERSTCQTNKATLEDAIERYRFDQGALPPAATFQTALQPDFIKKTFTCPNAGTYTMDASGNVTCSVAAHN